jgi:hypothetical protein
MFFLKVIILVCIKSFVLSHSVFKTQIVISYELKNMFVCYLNKIICILFLNMYRDNLSIKANYDSAVNFIMTFVLQDKIADSLLEIFINFLYVNFTNVNYEFT